MNTETFRIKARRAGNGAIITFSLPAAMSRALPEGGLVFDVFFTDDGIGLKYVGQEDLRSIRTVDAPQWANGEKA